MGTGDLLPILETNEDLVNRSISSIFPNVSSVLVASIIRPFSGILIF